MLDLFNLPKNIGNADVQVFSQINNAVSSSFNYNKPRGKTMLYCYIVGAGAGGGGGFSGIAGSARGGGGGGGSGAISTHIVPLSFLPDVLFVSPAPSALGGAAGVSGGSGGISVVTIVQDASTITNYLFRSGTGAAAGGGGGTGAAAGGGGSAAGVVAISNVPLAGIGLHSPIAGQAGTAGGIQTGAVGTAISLPSTGINVMGGTGGGGTTSADFAGGLITPIAGSLISESIPANALAGSNNGSGGFSLSKFMFNFPGLGGGSSNAGIGGDGGNGGYGAGGGGGGAGTTGGNGGNGGSGLVVMIAW